MKHLRRLFTPKTKLSTNDEAVNRRTFLRRAAEVLVVAAGAGTSAGLMARDNDKQRNGYGDMPYGGTSR
jgi:hypothetical protein